MRALAVSIAVMPALVSCAAVLGIEDRSVGEAGADVGDGGSPADRAAPAPEGGDDGAITVVDAGTDAGTDASFCASHVPAPTFCDEFERGAAVDSSWTPTINNGSTLTIAAATATKTTRSLFFVATKDAPESSACITHELAGPITVMKVELDVQIVERGSASFDFFRLGGVTGEQNIELESQENGMVAVDDESSILLPKKTTPIALSLAPSVWSHLEVTLTVQQTKVAIDTKIDGKTALKVTGQDSAPLTQGKVFVSLGDCATSGTLKWKAYLDNFAVTTQ